MMDLKFDAEGFRAAAMEWWHDNITNFESHQDAHDCLYEWLSANIGRFVGVEVK